MRATLPLRLRATGARTWGWIYRDNNVPHYQRMFQRHDGVRQWAKTPKSKVIIPVFYGVFWGTTAGVMWMTGRLILGHKTWFSSK